MRASVCLSRTLGAGLWSSAGPTGSSSTSGSSTFAPSPASTSTSHHSKFVSRAHRDFHEPVQVADQPLDRRYCFLEREDGPPRSQRPAKHHSLRSRTLPWRVPSCGSSPSIARRTIHPGPTPQPPWRRPPVSLPHRPSHTPSATTRTYSTSPPPEPHPPPRRPRPDLAVRADGPEPSFMATAEGLAGSPREVDHPAPHILSDEQFELHQLAIQGDSFFFTGAAGTGKSFLLRTIIEDLLSQGKRVAVTSSTGISAINIGGTTLHSWAGIGAAKGDATALLQRVLKVKSRVDKWRHTDVLIIDEVSMIPPHLFDTLHHIADSVLGTPAPLPGDDPRDPKFLFGGLQIIATGDFLQLPPVLKRPYGDTNLTEEEAKELPQFAFEAEYWEPKLGKPRRLKQIYRQTDPELIHHLNKVRIGDVDSATAAFFDQTATRRWNDGVLPTHLFPRNRQVQEMNMNRLAAIKQPTYRYLSHDAIDPAYWTKFRTALPELKYNLEDVAIAEQVDLKVGAQVLCRANIFSDVVNGSVGLVRGFMTIEEAHATMGEVTVADNGSDPAEDEWGRMSNDGKLIKQFPVADPDTRAKVKHSPAEVYQLVGGDKDPPDQRYPVVEIPRAGRSSQMYLFKPIVFYVTEPIESNPEHIVAVRKQLPLQLGYALSIHKSQGQAIDRVCVNCEGIFSEGHAYVAISRARSLEGLQVKGFELKYVQTSERVTNWMVSNGILDPLPPKQTLHLAKDGETVVAEPLRSWRKVEQKIVPGSRKEPPEPEPIKQSEEETNGIGDKLDGPELLLAREEDDANGQPFVARRARASPPHLLPASSPAKDDESDAWAWEAEMDLGGPEDHWMRDEWDSQLDDERPQKDRGLSTRRTR